jgi:hypothetical protein
MPLRLRLPSSARCLKPSSSTLCATNNLAQYSGHGFGIVRDPIVNLLVAKNCSVLADVFLDLGQDRDR